MPIGHKHSRCIVMEPELTTPTTNKRVSYTRRNSKLSLGAGYIVSHSTATVSFAIKHFLLALHAKDRWGSLDLRETV